MSRNQLSHIIDIKTLPDNMLFPLTSLLFLQLPWGAANIVQQDPLMATCWAWWRCGAWGVLGSWKHVGIARPELDILRGTVALSISGATTGTKKHNFTPLPVVKSRNLRDVCSELKFMQVRVKKQLTRLTAPPRSFCCRLEASLAGKPASFIGPSLVQLHFKFKVISGKWMLKRI